jgi:hypothetical protein
MGERPFCFSFFVWAAGRLGTKSRAVSFWAGISKFLNSQDFAQSRLTQVQVILVDLLCGDMRALSHDRGFHKQDEKGERHPNHGEDEERVEIGERGGLLLTKIFQRL